MKNLRNQVLGCMNRNGEFKRANRKNLNKLRGHFHAVKHQPKKRFDDEVKA